MFTVVERSSLATITGSQQDRKSATELAASAPETDDPESPMERLVRLQAECSSLQDDLMSLHQVLH
jgi:hypothetical protein